MSDNRGEEKKDLEAIKNQSQDFKINYLLDRVEDLHDEIYKNGYSERISRNTLRSKGALWVIGVVLTAGVGFFFTLI